MFFIVSRNSNAILHALRRYWVCRAKRAARYSGEKGAGKSVRGAATALPPSAASARLKPPVECESVSPRCCRLNARACYNVAMRHVGAVRRVVARCSALRLFCVCGGARNRGRQLRVIYGECFVTFQTSGCSPAIRAQCIGITASDREGAEMAYMVSRYRKAMLYKKGVREIQGPAP